MLIREIISKSIFLFPPIYTGLADFCTSFVVLVMLEMATSFHQWELDPLFSAAEVIQNSADRLVFFPIRLFSEKAKKKRVKKRKKMKNSTELIICTGFILVKYCFIFNECVIKMNIHGFILFWALDFVL